MENESHLQLSEGIARSFADSADTSPQKMRILVADGNATIRKLLKHGLAKEDFEIVEASDGHEALSLATQT